MLKMLGGIVSSGMSYVPGMRPAASPVSYTIEQASTDIDKLSDINDTVKSELKKFLTTVETLKKTGPTLDDLGNKPRFVIEKILENIETIQTSPIVLKQIASILIKYSGLSDQSLIAIEKDFYDQGVQKSQNLLWNDDPALQINRSLYAQLIMDLENEWSGKAGVTWSAANHSEYESKCIINSQEDSDDLKGKKRANLANIQEMKKAFNRFFLLHKDENSSKIEHPFTANLLGCIPIERPRMVFAPRVSIEQAPAPTSRPTSPSSESIETNSERGEGGGSASSTSSTSSRAMKADGPARDLVSDLLMSSQKFANGDLLQGKKHRQQEQIVSGFMDTSLKYFEENDKCMTFPVRTGQKIHEADLERIKSIFRYIITGISNRSVLESKQIERFSNLILSPYFCFKDIQDAWIKCVKIRCKDANGEKIQNQQLFAKINLEIKKNFEILTLIQQLPELDGSAISQHVEDIARTLFDSAINDKQLINMFLSVILRFQDGSKKETAIRALNEKNIADVISFVFDNEDSEIEFLKIPFFNAGLLRNLKFLIEIEKKFDEKFDAKQLQQERVSEIKFFMEKHLLELQSKNPEIFTLDEYKKFEVFVQKGILPEQSELFSKMKLNQNETIAFAQYLFETKSPSSVVENFFESFFQNKQETFNSGFCLSILQAIFHKTEAQISEKSANVFSGFLCAVIENEQDGSIKEFIDQNKESHKKIKLISEKLAKHLEFRSQEKEERQKIEEEYDFETMQLAEKKFNEFEQLGYVVEAKRISNLNEIRDLDLIKITEPLKKGGWISEDYKKQIYAHLDAAIASGKVTKLTVFLDLPRTGYSYVTWCKQIFEHIKSDMYPVVGMASVGFLNQILDKIKTTDAFHGDKKFVLDVMDFYLEKDVYRIQPEKELELRNILKEKVFSPVDRAFYEGFWRQKDQYCEKTKNAFISIFSDADDEKTKEIIKAFESPDFALSVIGTVGQPFQVQSKTKVLRVYVESLVSLQGNKYNKSEKIIEFILGLDDAQIHKSLYDSVIDLIFNAFSSNAEKRNDFLNRMIDKMLKNRWLLSFALLKKIKEMINDNDDTLSEKINFLLSEIERSQNGLDKIISKWMEKIREQKDTQEKKKIIQRLDSIQMDQAESMIVRNNCYALALENAYTALIEEETRSKSIWKRFTGWVSGFFKKR